MTPDELRALADALLPMAAAPCFDGIDVERAAAYLRAQADARPVAVPAGWKPVPVEPTPEMLSAVGMMDGYDWHAPGCSPDADHANWYSAMIAAAPAAPQAEPKPTPASGNDLNVYKEMATNYRNDAQAEPKREPLHELPPLPEPGAYAYEWRLQTGSVYRSFSARHYNGVPCDDQVLFFTADQMREYARTVLRTHGIGGSDE